MDKATTGAVLGTILGLAAGVGGMIAFAPRDDGRLEEMEHKVATVDADLKKLQDERDELRRSLEKANRDVESGRQLAETAGDLMDEKGRHEARARELEAELKALKETAGEERRQNEARIKRLEKVLADNGITQHLSDEEIAARINALEVEFNTAFGGKNKKAAMESLWAIQALGPRSYDKAIELWRKLAEDFGLNPWGEGPKELGMTMQDYVSLISEWGLVEKGLTDPSVPSDFRVASIYGTPWWSSEDPDKRAKLLGEILLTGSGYEVEAAIDALGDINSNSATRYLIDYLARNRDNPKARKLCISELAAKNTPDAWAGIEDAAQHDKDEDVRKHAQTAVDSNNVSVAGIRITFVDANSQGALAGIKLGDILTHYNAVRVKTIADINTAKAQVAEGESVKVTVRRGADDLTLTLGPGMIGINGVAVNPKE